MTTSTPLTPDAVERRLSVLGIAKITSTHLERLAVVYVRQSSPKQVREHQESQTNQRALVERAGALGWHPARVTVLDGDLGQSGTSTAGRDAFATLTSEVALGHVGIVFGWQVSRLARNNADWYHLLDLAALMGTLIADVEGVYDPRLYNDRLLLGLKGTMAEAELYLLRQRLNAGRLSKVQRGAYVQHLPTGLVRLPDGRVVLDPDAQVRQVISLVLATFAELGTCQKVLRHCKRHGLLLPRHQTSGFHYGELVWKAPSASAIYEIVRNPAYAGAFAYGRRPTDPQRRVPGRHATGFVRKPLAEWVCCRQGVYPAYISWEQYLANQQQLHDHAQRYPTPATPELGGRGTPRQGAALLQGLATCGHCGHRMRVAYKPQIRYLCDGLAGDFAERMCASLDGASVEALVVQAFFAALHPAHLDALEALLAQHCQDQAAVQQHAQLHLQRAQYEVHVARRRYQAADPDNRLVAAELERTWEEGLVALRQAEEALERAQRVPEQPTLSPGMREQLTHIAQTLPTLWQDGQLTNEHKKQLLRSLVARVILKRTKPDAVEVKIVWVSGHFSVQQLTPPIHRQRDVSHYAEFVARLHTLYEQGHTDAQMAAQLTREGFHTARNHAVSSRTVLKIRRQHGWVSHYHRHRRADKVEGNWTIHGLAQILGVDRDWFYRRIYAGRLRAPDVERLPGYGNYVIRDDPALLQRLRDEAAAARRAAQTPS